ncbi:MAG: serine hydrolase domain-containing protein [Vicinamibacterales bacterium]
MRTATLARRVRLGTLVALLASAWTVVSAARSPLQIASPPSSITVERAMAAIEAAQQPNRQGWDPFTLAEMMDRLHVPGLGIAVIWNGQVHWARGYGVADVTTGAPVTPTTLFQAASISKPVAAMATMRAVQSGALTLDTDINDLLTTWRLPSGPFTADRPVTPRALLSHTSGLGDGFGFPGYSPTEERPSVLQILEGRPPSNVGRLFMERPPMTAFKYSGGGTLVMQQALSDRLHRPFLEIVRDAVLTPIGMHDSDYDQPPTGERAARTARAHDGRGQPMGDRWHVYPELAAAGLWTTPGDLARFAIDVQRAVAGDAGRAISPALAREMVSPVGVGDYGVGFELSHRGEGWYFGHGGSNWGFRAQVLAHRVKGYGIAVMTNGDNGSRLIDEVIARVAHTYGWDSLDKSVPR